MPPVTPVFFLQMKTTCVLVHILYNVCHAWGADYLTFMLIPVECLTNAHVQFLEKWTGGQVINTKTPRITEMHIGMQFYTQNGMLAPVENSIATQFYTQSVSGATVTKLPDLGRDTKICALYRITFAW